MAENKTAPLNLKNYLKQLFFYRKNKNHRQVYFKYLKFNDFNNKTINYIRLQYSREVKRSDNLGDNTKKY